MNNPETAMTQAADSHIIAMSGIRKVYDTGKVKVEKGGWWGSNPFVARSAYRHYEDPPDYGDKHIGFRVVTVGR